jgi:activator of HSP90 ATPase
MQTSFRLKTKLPARPAAVYRAWLSGAGHSAMTGASATASDKEGGSFTAWDGYITGRNVTLKPEWCIVQAWRTSQFSQSDPDSRLELCIHPSGDGSELLLIHTNIPPDQAAGYEAGWVDHYFEPMKKYFSSLAPKKSSAAKSAKKPAKKGPAKRKAAKKKVARKKSTKKKKPAKKKSAKRRARRR